MPGRAYRTSAIVLSTSLFLHVAAYANAGVPMLGVVWPLAWYAFFPIVIVEAIVCSKLTGISWSSSLAPSLVANAASTFVGIPLTWFLLVLIDMFVTKGGSVYGLDTPVTTMLSVILQAPWLRPYPGQLDWMIPAATTTLLPFFGLASVCIEKPVFAKITACGKPVAAKWAWRANLITYGIAMAASIIWLLIRIAQHVPPPEYPS